MVNKKQKYYKNSLRRLHEDKIRTEDPKARYLSKRICSELTEALKEFNVNSFFNLDINIKTLFNKG